LEAEERADLELERFVGRCRDGGAQFERLVAVARRLPAG
jgi:hypothetical protein